MRRPYAAFALFAWSAVVLGGTGCNLILGLEPPIVDTTASTSSGDGGGTSTTGTGGTGAGATGGTGGVTVEDPPCDAGETPEAAAIYVSAGSGDDAAGDGSALSPFATIGVAISAAKATQKTKVLLEVGVYPETLALTDLPLGLYIDGAWERTGAQWTRVCTPGFRDLTVLQSPDAIGVSVDGLSAPSGLSNLTVATKSTGASPAQQSGETIIGVRVRGDNSAFALMNVAVIAGHGGDGGLAGTVAPSGDLSCDGLVGCGLVVGQDASAASAGTAGQDATIAGVFDALGVFSATDGAPGASAGIDGAHGGKGGAPACENNAFLGCWPPGPDCMSHHGQVCAAPGTCGCGGIGGLPGLPGHGGGASVALLVAGTGAAVSFAYTELRTSGGGDGSAGGAGGLGGPGTVGAVGINAVANVGGTCAGKPFCTSDCTCENNPDWGASLGTNITLQGGTAGGHGGPGGAGGPGGNGSGGPSYAIVRVGGALAIGDAFSLQAPGPGGASGGGRAAAGDSADELVVP